MKMSLGPSEIQRINIILGIGIVCLLGLFGFLSINQPDMFACKCQEGVDCVELEDAYNKCMNHNNGYKIKCEMEESRFENCSNNKKNKCEILQKRANEIFQEGKKFSDKFSEKKCGQIENINKSECKVLQKKSDGILHDYSLIMDKLKANKCNQTLMTPESSTEFKRNTTSPDGYSIFLQN